MTQGAVLSLDIPELETERLRLRGFTVDDVAPERGFMTSDRAKGIGGPLPPNQAWRSICGFIGHWVLRGYGFWAVEEKATGRYLGRVGLWFPDGWPEPEIGWSLTAEGEGRGIAHEAALASRAYAYDTLGWTTAISMISPDNVRSIALAERMGCTRDPDFEHAEYGTMGVWRHPGPEALA